MDLDIPPCFDLLSVRFAIGFIFGAALGSFGTMLAYRLPRRMSIVAPRSHCPSCGMTLGAQDLVPIFSWLASQGRCRHCEAVIGTRYLAIEIACSLGCGIATVLLGYSPWIVAAYAVIVAGVVAVGIKVQ